MSTLLYIDKIPASQRVSFSEKLGLICQALKIPNPNWLMQLFNAESGVNPAAQNKKFPFKNGFATGLIQFTPDTAAGLGTTTGALLLMTAAQQLDYVKKYFMPFRGKIDSYEKLYLATFLPALVNKVSSDDTVFAVSGLSASSIAVSNPVIDLNKDKKITYGEFKQYVRNTVVPGNFDLIFGEKNFFIVSQFHLFSL